MLAAQYGVSAIYHGHGLLSVFQFPAATIQQHCMKRFIDFDRMAA